MCPCAVPPAAQSRDGPAPRLGPAVLSSRAASSATWALGASEPRPQRLRPYVSLPRARLGSHRFRSHLAQNVPEGEPGLYPFFSPSSVQSFVLFAVTCQKTALLREFVSFTSSFLQHRVGRLQGAPE